MRGVTGGPGYSPIFVDDSVIMVSVGTLDTNDPVAVVEQHPALPGRGNLGYPEPVARGWRLA